MPLRARDLARFVLAIDDDAGTVEAGVGPADGRDHPVSATLGWSQIDEQDLVLTMMDDLSQRMFAPRQIGGGEPALEH